MRVFLNFKYIFLFVNAELIIQFTNFYIIKKEFLRSLIVITSDRSDVTKSLLIEKDDIVQKDYFAKNPDNKKDEGSTRNAEASATYYYWVFPSVYYKSKDKRVYSLNVVTGD